MAHSFDLKETVALVTGAGGGIGAALAFALAKAGATLVLVDKNAAGLDTTAARIASIGGKTSVHALDLVDEAAILALEPIVRAEHGRLDLLVNNAGVAYGGTFADMELDDFEWVMDINFRATVRMTHAFLPMLRAAPKAQIVNISSLYGIVAPPGQTAYSASKFAVRGFSEALRHEYLGTPLGVTVVHPGGVATGIARNARISSKLDPREVEKGQKQMEKLLKLSPEKAAAQIMRGIETRAWRVIVGNDAKMVTLVQRVRPVRYWLTIARLVRA